MVITPFILWYFRFTSVIFFILPLANWKINWAPAIQKHVICTLKAPHYVCAISKRLYRRWLYLLIYPLPDSLIVLSRHWSMAEDQHGSQIALPSLPGFWFARRAKVPVPSVFSQHVRFQWGLCALWAHPKGRWGW